MSKKLPGDYIIDAYSSAAIREHMTYGKWKAAHSREYREQAADEYARKKRGQRKKNGGGH